MTHHPEIPPDYDPDEDPELIQGFANTLKELSSMIADIQALGYDKETATDYAILIGDLIITDENGLVIVRDPETKAIIARLKLQI